MRIATKQLELTALVATRLCVLYFFAAVSGLALDWFPLLQLRAQRALRIAQFSATEETQQLPPRSLVKLFSGHLDFIETQPDTPRATLAQSLDFEKVKMLCVEQRACVDLSPFVTARLHVLVTLAVVTAALFCYLCGYLRRAVRLLRRELHPLCPHAFPGARRDLAWLAPAAAGLWHAARRLRALADALAPLVEQLANVGAAHASQKALTLLGEPDIAFGALLTLWIARFVVPRLARLNQQTPSRAPTETV